MAQPHSLVPLISQNKKVLLRLLFEASAKTLLEVAADHKHLGAEIGFLSILHTWGRLCNVIHTFTVSCRAAACPRTGNAGSVRDSFCRSESWAGSFGASS